METTTTSSTWHTLILDWRSWLIASGLRDATITLRIYQIRRYSEDNPHPWDATTQSIATWIGSHDWSLETRKSMRSALRGFYRWAVEIGHSADDPTAILPVIRSAVHPPRPAPEDVVDQALIHSDERIGLMVRLAARQGLRRGEISRIHSTHVVPDLVGWSLRVHGKGGKVRIVPLAADIARDLLSRPQGWIFPSPSGGHLTAHHVGKLVQRALPDGWTAHTLRHRFATAAYSGTRDLLAVQELMGHSRPETTRGYILLPQDSLRAAVAAAA